ncbi:unnamed protein product [Bursaphelenchus xylophilus]|uniref:(pine wood nematode) hypothetical protein n=1 Tax=Bursaphelenchus xylophilus TaxID=6326 RepID=A0A1I7S0Z7_BURXY|nr:unnamed protein product [Bursaphelenchus xylophilus]CAG9087931.1 unnamed protein product [Bursaphelenchus xylophilus]
MGARQSFPSEVEPRQRSSSSSEGSTERTRRLHNARNGENFSTDSEDFDGNEFASSSNTDPSALRFSFRPPSSRISFLQAISAGMNHGSNMAHSSSSDARERRSMPALKFLGKLEDLRVILGFVKVYLSKSSYWLYCS